jgi:hypothetical protein
MGPDAVGGALVTSDPATDNRTGRARQRLTVARASADQRADLADAMHGIVLRADDLTNAAVDVAAERSAQRAAARARLDTATARLAHDADMATSRLDQLHASRQALLDGAAWAEQVEAELPRLAEAVDLARDHLERRQAEQRAARAGVDRVLEQRAAASSAMDDADRKLAELVGVGMDESGLRRELEAAGGAVHAARGTHAAAAARLEALLAERDAVEARCAELRDAIATQSQAGAGADADIDGDVDVVQTALDRWVAAASRAGLDPDAQALADAFTDLRADLDQVEAQAGPRPDKGALQRAQEAADKAALELERLEAAAKVPALSPADRAAIEAAHAAAVAAEERTDRRFGASAARKRVEETRAAEREMLDRFGFASYLDVVLSGGRGVIASPERLAAERAYLAAKATRDGVQKALRSSPELDYLESEHARLLRHAVERLGVDPGGEVIALLRSHPLVPGQVVDDLRDALALAGVRPVGTTLPEAAEAWLRTHSTPTRDQRPVQASASEAAAELEILVARGIAIVDEVAAAREQLAHAAERLELSGRSVGAFEAELSVRAGEDSTRLQRFAAAEELRTQIEALATTLARAEDEARTVVDRATEIAVAAEVALDRALATLVDLGRRARKLAESLPVGKRPDGDPLTTLLTLATCLRDSAEVLPPEIAAAEAVARTAADRVAEAAAIAEAAGTGAEGPRAEDVEDALRRLLAVHEDALVVLDDPFPAYGADLRPRLLEVILHGTGTGPLVLLTDDADVLGWAIGLPADQGTVAPADSLLNLGAHEADTQSSDSDPSDVAPRTLARRRAGQR